MSENPFRFLLFSATT